MNNVKVELYNKSFTEKIGDLTNCISCIVKEERNGLFDLDLVYPINDPLFHELKEENIIVCNANDTLKSQKFRIYNTGKLGSNKIQVYAMHISYDLVYDFVKNIDIKNQSCEYVLNTLFRSSIFSQHYKGYSDIVNAQNYKMDRANVLQAIAGKQGSIIDTFGSGAEILRDNENIHVLNKRGNDNGVVIEYGVNQTDFKLETDIVELETRIQPRAVYQNEAGEEVEVIAPFVDSPYINDYAHPYINYERDYSDKFENGEVPTVEKLTKFAQDDFKINKIDIPKYNFKIEFIPLSKCVGYESIRDKISICDIATIKDKRYNVDTKAKVIKYEFNVLKDRYNSMEIGEPRTTLGDIITGSNNDKVSKDEVKDIINNSPSTNYPNTLPNTPVVTLKAGLGVIAIDWTFEAKNYYTYEVYASRTKDFTPNTFDLIFKGQASNYSHYTEPKQTWYYRVRAINSHGSSTDFSEQKFATTGIIDKDSQWIGKAAIGNAQIGTLSLDRGWVDQLKGQWIDAKQLTVTDGNGKRTLDIDSFGNVDIKARNISMIVDGEEQGVVGETKFTQTMNGFEFKVDTAITSNLVLNGDFEGGLNSWIPQRWDKEGAEYVEPMFTTIKGDGTNYVPIGKTVANTVNKGIQPNSVHLGFYQDMEELIPNETYTVSCYMAGHRIYNAILEVKYRNSSGAWVTPASDWKIPSTATPNPPTFEGYYTKYVTTFTVPEESKGNMTVSVWADGNNFEGGNPQSFLWVGDIQLEKGEVAHPFRKNVNEVQGDVTQITGKGVTIKHDLGSFSNFNAKELSQANENGDKTVSIRNGSFRVYQFPSEGNNYNAYLGGFFATKLVGRTEYGLAQGGTSSCGYISQGFAETDSETVTPSFYPWLRMVHYDGNGGDNFNKQGTFSLKPFYIAHLLNFWHDPTPDLPSRIYPSTDNGLDLNIYGNDGIDLGVRYGSTGKVGLRIDETSSSPYVTHFHWGTHNFHNYAMYNTNIVKALDAKSYQLKNKIANESSIENETYNNYSFFNNEIRYCDRQEYIITENNDGTRTLLVEIPQILAENIELDYHINISKLSWGDYRIIEKNPYYFIIETNSTNNFRFTFELVVRLIEEKQLFISKLGDEIYSMPNSPEECKDEDIKEDLNSNYTLLDEDKSDKLIAIEKLKEENELWKMYKR